jgi:excisionase family DNA binding protein
MRLLNAREVADLFGVSTETILRWTRNGDLPAVRLSNRAIRYRDHEIEAWLESRSAGTVDLHPRMDWASPCSQKFTRGGNHGHHRISA